MGTLIEGQRQYKPKKKNIVKLKEYLNGKHNKLGKIYDTTHWGVGVTSNTINWGKVYVDFSSAISGLLSSLQSRSTYYENQSGANAILQELENCTS